MALRSVHRSLSEGISFPSDRNFVAAEAGKVFNSGVNISSSSFACNVVDNGNSRLISLITVIELSYAFLDKARCDSWTVDSRSMPGGRSAFSHEVQAAFNLRILFKDFLSR